MLFKKKVETVIGSSLRTAQKRELFAILRLLKFEKCIVAFSR